MDSDFKEILSAFNAHAVKYLIVGGYAVSFHSQPRATKDLAIFVKPDAQNAHAVFAALASFGAPLAGLQPLDFQAPDEFFRMGQPPLMIEILPSIQGVEFDRAWERRIEAVIDPASGLTAHMISRKDLIAAKLSAARPQDLADVDAIRKAGESQEPGT